MISRVFILAILLVTVFRLHAQDFRTRDYRGVDSFALTVKYKRDLVRLVTELTDTFPEDIDKVRSIFRWVTENIRYDYDFINRDKEIIKPDCISNMECWEKMNEWEESYIRKILRTRRAIADGYSRLVKKLCDICGLQCEIINGFYKSKPYQIANPISANHYWNMVAIDNEWYNLDATLAAGDCPEDEDTGLLLPFIKKYKNYYWLTPADRFFRNHFPKNSKWVQDPSYTKEKFLNMPHYYGLKMLEDVSNENPSTGYLVVKKGDVIHFRFDYAGEIKKLQINSNVYRNPSLWYTEQVSRRRTRLVRDTFADRRQVYIPFTRKGNTVEFDYKVTENSLYYLELLFDYKKAMRFRVKVEEEQ